MQYTLKKSFTGKHSVAYKCQQCQADLSSDLEEAGQMFPCPTCGNQFTVPGRSVLEKIRAEKLAERQKTAPPHMPAPPAAPVPRPATPLPYQRAIEATPTDHSPGELPHVGGNQTPRIALLPGERILEIFEAGLWDLGLFGWLFGFKKRLILTNFRLFRFEKKIITNYVDSQWLEAIKGVVVGQTLRSVPFAAGLLFAFWGLSTMLGGLLGAAGGRHMSDSLLSLFGGTTIGLIFLVIAAVLIYLSRVKVMLASTGYDKTGMKLTRLQPEESKRFVDSIYAALHELHARR